MTPSKLKFKARILHVLSQVEITGAETYAATIANAQVQQGHQVFIVSDTFASQTSAQVFAMPIANRRWPTRLKNIRQLRKFVRENEIDFVHAHSRAASWVCHYALKSLKVPLISSVHGRQHIHRSSRGKDIYGERIIAVCENIKSHLVKELSINPAKILVAPNAFQFLAPVARKNQRKTIAIIGRASGPKGERTAQIISDLVPRLLTDYPDLEVRVVGASWEKFSHRSQERMQQACKKFPDKIKFMGFISDLANLIAESTVVIASGRVAVETIWQQIPLVAVGESLTPGLVTVSNQQEAFESNFGDCAALQAQVNSDADLKLINDGIRDLFDSRNKVDCDLLAEKSFERYNLDTVMSQLEDAYMQARMIKVHPNHIPNLMYHKVPDQEIQSRHRIFVPKTLFEKQMRKLSKMGFKVLTFKEYDEFRSGLRPISQFPKNPIFITFDDAYVDNLTNALPAVKRYGLNFTLFSLGDSSIDHNKWDTANGDDRTEIMTIDQKRHLLAEGVEFGAHSMSHRDMTTLPDSENLIELEQSKKILKQELGLKEEVLVYAYPYGKVNDQVKALARKAGYKYAVATDTGGLHLEDDPYQIFRVNIFPEDTGLRFWKKIQPWYRAYYFKKRGH